MTDWYFAGFERMPFPIDGGSIMAQIGGTPFIPIGHAGMPPNITNLGALAGVTIDATNEAVVGIGQIFWEDAGSHTIDTSGASSIQWRSVNATFVNAGTTVIVGVAPVDAATGPPPRAANTTDVINFDVSCTLTGGSGGIANGGWNTSVPTVGTKTMAHGDLIAVCIQMTAHGGADTMQVGILNNPGGAAGQRPSVTSFLSAAYATAGGLPNFVIAASDGKLGFIFGCSVINIISGTAFNSGSSPNERGNLMIMPFGGKIHGIIYSCTIAGATSDFDLVLYSDPLGTPVAQKTVSIDANTVPSTANIFGAMLFSSPYTFIAGQTIAAIYKPTTANNITPAFVTLNNASHMKAFSLGTNAYAVNRSSGAFGVQNSNLDRYQIGVLVESIGL